MAERTLKIVYTGNARGALGAIKQIEDGTTSLGDKFRQFGQKVSSVGRGLTTGLTLPLVGFGALALKEFGDASKGIAQTGAVLKSTGGVANVTESDVASLTTRLGRLVVVDNDVVRSGTNMLLTFRNIRNEAGAGNDVFNQANRALLNMATAMNNGAAPSAEQLSSKAIQLGKALNDPIAGISALGRAGIQFSDQQKKQITTMVKAGDILGAQKAILAELNKEFGGSAKAAGEAAPPMQRLAVAGQQLAETAGSILAPMIEKLAGWLQQAATWFQNLSPEAQRIGVIIGVVAAALGPLLLLLGGLVTALGVIISPIGLIVVGLAALGAAFMLAYNRSESFRNGVQAVLAAIKGAVSGFVSAVLAFWGRFGDEILAQVRLVWGFIKGQIQAALNVIRGIITVVMGLIRGDWSQAWQGIKQIFGGIWDGIKNVVMTAFGALKNLIKAVLEAIGSSWERVWEGVKSFFAGIWTSIVGVARTAFNILIGFINGIIRGLNAMVNALDVALGPFINLPDIPSIPALARGGRVIRSGMAIVGEAGPELLNLPSGADVIPARGRGGVGGTTIVLNVSAPFGSAAELTALIKRELLMQSARNGFSIGLA